MTIYQFPLAYPWRNEMKIWFVVLFCFSVLIPLWPSEPASAADKAVYLFRVPEENTIPGGKEGDMIRRGRLLVTHTPRELPQYALSALRCSNCHLKEGTVAYAAPWVGVIYRYPQYSPRSGKNITLAQRIQGCFLRSLNGVAPAEDSEPMQAIIAYMGWLSRDVPSGVKVENFGFPYLEHPRIPKRELGKGLFQDRCAVCHGEDGGGRLDEEPLRLPYGFPPLWGDKSFNAAAGMAQLNMAAAFIKRKMPFAAGGTLTDQEAYDIADFVIHQPRPDSTVEKIDKPKRDKPDNAHTVAATGQEIPDDAELLRQAQFRFDSIPQSPPSYPENPLTEEKIALGKMLFFEPRLSSSQVVSCNTCHNLGLGGVDLQEKSLGHRWQSTTRNAPTVLNSVFSIAQFWDGRARDLAEQAGGPLLGLTEMASSDPSICQVLASIPEYVEAFDKAFPGHQEPICFGNARKALEAFEITLLTPDAPVDLFLSGDLKALDKTTKKGLHLFMSKGCADCHMSMNIGGNGYYVFGVKKKPDCRYLPSEDHGCRTVLVSIAEDYVFKAPSLRNVALTSPYFHSGSAGTLAGAVEVMADSQLGIRLEDQEVAAIVAFLQTLTGHQPEITYPILPVSTAQTPRPKK